MKIVSTELSQVFKAYTKQLRGEYERVRSTRGRESVAAGFERVDISDEARVLAQSSLAVDAVDGEGSPAYSYSQNSTEDEEKEAVETKEPSDSDRE